MAPEHPGGEESFGQRLRQLRLERGLSQRRLSGPGVSYAYVSRLEAGARRPSMKAIRLLARKLAVSPEYLETGRELAPREERELRVGDLELELRLERGAPEAEQELLALAEDAEADGEGVTAARARSVLGLALHERGRLREAIEQLERAVEDGRLSPLTDPDVYCTLGHAYSATGQADRAVALLEHCLAESGEGERADPVAHVRFATYMSSARAEAGDVAGARGVLADALARADADLDPRSRVRLHRGRAWHAGSEQDPRTALREVRRALALLETIDETRRLAHAHLLHAELLTLDGDPDAAATSLDRAELLLGERPHPEDLRRLRAEQARCAVRAGRGEDAVARAREALELTGEEDAAGQGAALCALGEGLDACGRSEESVEPLRRAVDLLEATDRMREASQAAKSLAAALRRLDRGDEAFAVLERATALAERIGGPRPRV